MGFLNFAISQLPTKKVSFKKMDLTLPGILLVKNHPLLAIKMEKKTVQAPFGMKMEKSGASATMFMARLKEYEESGIPMDILLLRRNFQIIDETGSIQNGIAMAKSHTHAPL